MYVYWTPFSTQHMLISTTHVGVATHMVSLRDLLPCLRSKMKGKSLAADFPRSWQVARSNFHSYASWDITTRGSSTLKVDWAMKALEAVTETLHPRGTRKRLLTTGV